jgi:protein-S-isoprenylcysteine O-methyltransferase Ste14
LVLNAKPVLKLREKHQVNKSPCQPGGETGNSNALVVLAIAQIGVHLVFFLNITTGPDNVNNVMALAFGVLMVLLLLTGSLWIMAHMNHNMMPMDQIMRMQP